MKKKIFSIFIVFCLILTAFLFYPNNKNKQNINKQELKGCWFSYQDWNEHLNKKNKEDFTNSVKKILINLQNMKCNALFLHLRAFGDSMYNSKLFPLSKYSYGSFDGQLNYDPLRIIVEESKKFNIDVHGWINPMRTTDDNDFNSIDNKYLIKQWYNSNNRFNYYIKDQLGRYIMIPGNPEVVQLINDGVKELLDNYNLKGIHIDDYFYPTGVDTLENNDKTYYESLDCKENIETWRRLSTSKLVKSLYNTVHSYNKGIVFGVSPQANIENNYYKMYIDVKQWLSNEGYIDYIMPQIYYGFNNSSSPFDVTAKKWSELISNKNINYYVGLAGYKLNIENDANAGAGNKEWYEVSKTSKDILKRQEEYLKMIENYNGYCLYTYSSFVNSDTTLKQETSDELNNLKSVIK